VAGIKEPVGVKRLIPIHFRRVPFHSPSNPMGAELSVKKPRASPSPTGKQSRPAQSQGSVEEDERDDASRDRGDDVVTSKLKRKTEEVDALGKKEVKRRKSGAADAPPPAPERPGRNVIKNSYVELDEVSDEESTKAKSIPG
jgi:hypothetical protein